MIGKPQWFKVRKYGGWGLSPATKEGWLYIAGFIGLVLIIQNLPLTQSLKTAITTVLGVIMVTDVIDIMFHFKRDERETLHEAISERNASWAMVTAMVGIFGYKAIVTAINGGESVDIIMLIPIFVGTLTKAVTNFYLRNK
jgi:uncharacterized membrane protein YdcZ (DUF606 family)